MNVVTEAKPANANQAEHRHPPRLVAAMAFLSIATTIGLSLVAIQRYRACSSDWAFDMAFFHNLVFNAAFGGGFRQTASTHEWDGLVNLTHAFFLLPVYVPFYRLAPRMETLLILQSAALAAGVFAVASLARSSGARTWTAFLAATLYATSFAFWRLGLADFRPLLLSVPALLWLAAALHRRSHIAWVLLATVVVCAVREELPLLVASLALCTLLARRGSRRAGFASLVVAIAWFGGQSWLRPRAGFYIPFDRPADLVQGAAWATSGPGETAARLSFLAEYFQWGFWPAILDPVLLLASVPLLFYALLLSPYEWWTWHGPYVHHLAPLLALVTAAGAVGWGKLEAMARRRLPAMAWIVPVTMLVLVGFQVPRTVHRVMWTLGFLDDPPARQARKMELAAIESLIEQIPGDGRVATDYRLVARLSGRPYEYVYQAEFAPGRPEGPFDCSRDRGGGAGGPGKWVAASSRVGTAIRAWKQRCPGLDGVDWMLVYDAHQEWMSVLERSEVWVEVDRGGSYVLFRRLSGG